MSKVIISCLLSMVFSLGIVFSGQSDAISDAIKVNQVGYRPQDKKIFIVLYPADMFYIKDIDGKIVYEGNLTDPVWNEVTGNTVQQGDFSKVKIPGEYFVSVPGVGESFRFDIAKDVYLNVLYKTMRSFYLQRCGMAVDGGDGFKRGACHLKDAFFLEGMEEKGKKDVTGGWHDAGDYGKYITNAGITVWTLLAAYDKFPDSFSNLILNIPETGKSKMPDILSEIKWQLDWFLKMQREDGAVHFKVAPIGFPSAIMPEKDKSRRYIFPVSSVAAGNFAAVMAKAARIFKKYDADFAEKCLIAAEKTWKWLEENPEMVPEGGFDDPWIVGGYEGDLVDKDERLWAAAELFRTTGEEKYNDFFKKYFRYGSWSRSAVDFPPSWLNTQVLGMLTYYFTDQPNVDTKIQDKIKIDTLAYANLIVADVKKDGYNVGLRKDMYFWGSNAVALNLGMILLHANKMEPQQEFVDAALDQLHYILGRNSLNKTFITGIGDNPVLNPHFAPSMADENILPWPGFVVGGPNYVGGDGPLNRLFSANKDEDGNLMLPVAKRFVDVDPSFSMPEIGHFGQTSFASNEPCISYNAPMIFVLAAFQ